MRHRAAGRGQQIPSRWSAIEAGHFVWEGRAGEYTSLIADWVADGYARHAGRSRP